VAADDRPAVGTPAGATPAARTPAPTAPASKDPVSGTPGGRSAPADQSVGELVRDASTQVSTLVRAEIELAKAELSATAKRAGVGAGFVVAAGVIALLSLPFLFVTLAEVLVAVGLPRWSAYLIVWGLFVVVAAILGLIGYRVVRKLRAPERTIETVKETARWARHPTEPVRPAAVDTAPSSGSAGKATAPRGGV